MPETAPPPTTVRLLHVRKLAAATPGTTKSRGDNPAHGAKRAEVLIHVTGAQLRRGDTRAFQALTRRLESPRCGGVHPGGLEIVFPDGSADAPLYLQPELREYARRLETVYPAWFYPFSASGEGLLALTLARLESVRTVQVRRRPGVAVAFCRREFQEFFLDQSRLVRPLFTRAGLGRAAYHQRLAEISRRFGLTEPGDWAEPT